MRSRPVLARCGMNGDLRPVRPLRSAWITAATLLITVGGCAGSARPPADAATAAAGSSDEVHIQLVTFNDVYEIMPTGDGRTGGPARTATLLSRLEATNPFTVAILAGDLLSPSALGTARVDGERLQGRQMVAVMNAMHLDFATFGNHEFDLGEAVLRDRLRESEFSWISSNVRSRTGEPLPNVVPHAILRFPLAGRDTLRLALLGVTMDRDDGGYALISEPVGAAVAAAELLRDSAEITVAITHMSIAEDIALAQSTSDIDLIVGGHDHENLLVRRGAGLVPIAKADANLRTVFVHDLIWNRTSRSLRVESELVQVTDAIAADPSTDAVARQWERRGFDGFRGDGFQPDRVIARSPVPLDGTEASVLGDTTTLTRLIAEAMLAEAPGAAASIYNAGSIRIDDVLPPGPLTEYDVIRILPFGGLIVDVEVTGAVLRRILAQGESNSGTGGFIHTAGISGGAGNWTVGGRDIDDDERYRVVISDFLLSGREQGLDWLTRDHPDVRVIRELRDVRFTLIDQLARVFPTGR